MQDLSMLPDTTPLSPARQLAASRFAAQGWPGKSVEAFRFTPLDALNEMALTSSDHAALSAASAAAEAPVANTARIAIDAGRFNAAASDAMPAGMQLSDLQDNAEKQAALFADLPETHPVANLSFAEMSAGIHLHVTKAAADTMVMLDYQGGTADGASHPVIVIEIEEGASLKLIENHQSAHGLSAPLVMIRMGANSQLQHARLQDVAAQGHFVGLSHITLHAGARLNSFTLAKGGALSRCETHVEMQGEEANCELSHIYLGAGTQLQDVTTRLHHAVPNCQSNQVIRGVLDDTSSGVFQGMVRVAPDAQKTDGQQMSRALLLSRDAEADAKPELEIFADDVVCSHGATVGELDETHLFYLKSRGIPEAEARSLLIRAFLLDGLEQIDDEDMAGWLAEAVQSWADTAGEQL